MGDYDNDSPAPERELRAYRTNHFPRLSGEFQPDQDDPLMVLAGDDADSLRVVYEPYVVHWVPRIEAWAALGAQPQEVDALLSLKPGTMAKLMKIFPKIYEAWAYGYHVAKQELLDSAYRRALNGNTKLTTFLLSAIYGVREKKETEITNNITVTAEIGANGEIGKKITTDDINQAIDAEFVPLPPGKE